ncbi:fungal-specific transcription factor domain-containing protein [Lipomyces kononenkoae]|uniref:Fungal-specific transcription factor domain-containing protein n=1 Tax=Lipomyces kononenkoae TaxID=34357 RepID=A0ACC3TA81_LIPKO
MSRDAHGDIPDSQDVRFGAAEPSVSAPLSQRQPVQQHNLTNQTRPPLGLMHQESYSVPGNAQHTMSPQLPSQHQSHLSHGLSGASPASTGASSGQSPVPSKRKGSRTGQACDRCKLRKIKCNATNGACTPCTLARVPCTNTDLNSRRAVPRGYVESLESQVASFKSRVQELESILVKLAPSIDLANLPRPDQVSVLKQQHSSPTVLPSIETLTSITLPPGQSAERKYDDTRLPVYVGEHLSSPDQRVGSWDEATLSIFGIHINLRDLAPGNLGDANFFEIFSTPKPVKMELPPYDEAKLYVESYIAVIHPVIPALSKSWLVQEIHRLYSDDNYKPTAQTAVIINMAFALITSSIDLYQRKLDKNRENYTPVSDTFYRRVIPYIHDLFHKPDLTSIQALVLILVYLRPSPRPQSSWALGRLAMTIAIQVGLHRENLQSLGSAAPLSLCESQMRKRVFWCLLSLESAISNRLGRPLALNNKNFDTELPLAVDDEYLDGTTDYTKIENPCSFLPGLALFGLTMISSKVYSTFYTVRKPTAEEYERLVVEFEAELGKWNSDLPESLTWKPSDSTGDLRDKRYAGIMWLTMNELRLFIRHPSGSTTTNQQFNDESRKLSVTIARELLHTMDNLMKINHVESTWYNVSMLLTSLFTILYGAWSQKDLSREDIDRVKEDVAITLSVIDEIAISLGTDVSNNKMRDVVSGLSEETLKKLEERYSQDYYQNQSREEVQQPHIQSQMHQQRHHRSPLPAQQPLIPQRYSLSNEAYAIHPNQVQVGISHAMSGPLSHLVSASVAAAAEVSMDGTHAYGHQSQYASPAAAAYSGARQPHQPSPYPAPQSVQMYEPSPHQPNMPSMASQATPYLWQLAGLAPPPPHAAAAARSISRRMAGTPTGTATTNGESSVVPTPGLWLDGTLSWQDYVFTEMQTLEKLSYAGRRKENPLVAAAVAAAASAGVGVGPRPGTPGQGTPGPERETNGYENGMSGSYYG